ncbi:hypothetical protein T4C_11077, partial [Trichinella pseudospiralis]
LKMRKGYRCQSSNQHLLELLSMLMVMTFLPVMFAVET